MPIVGLRWCPLHLNPYNYSNIYILNTKQGKNKYLEKLWSQLGYLYCLLTSYGLSFIMQVRPYFFLWMVFKLFNNMKEFNLDHKILCNWETCLKTSTCTSSIPHIEFSKPLFLLKSLYRSHFFFLFNIDYVNIIKWIKSFLSPLSPWNILLLTSRYLQSILPLTRSLIFIIKITRIQIISSTSVLLVIFSRCLFSLCGYCLSMLQSCLNLTITHCLGFLFEDFSLFFFIICCICIFFVLALLCEVGQSGLVFNKFILFIVNFINLIISIIYYLFQ